MQVVYHVAVNYVGNQPHLFILTKRCNTCTQAKPFDEFAYDNAQKDGYAGRCKQCKSECYQNASKVEKEHRLAIRKASEDARREDIRAQDRQRHNNDEARAKRRERNRPKIEARRQRKTLEKLNAPPAPPLTHKLCPACNPPIPKPVDAFGKDSRRNSGLAPYCKECTQNRAHARLEKRREYESNRLLDPAYKQTKRDALNEWRRAHPLGQRELTLRRNARKKEATIEKVDFQHILERDQCFCYICERDIAADEPIDFDHVVPLSLGGMHCESNIKVTHRSCNRRKGTKLLEEMTPLERYSRL